MSKSVTDQAMALAGMFQALALVQQAAQRGQVDLESMDVCLRSLFVIDADQTEDVYGGVQNLRPGFEQMVSQLSSTTKRDMELARYLVTLLYLERKLSKRKDLLNTVSEGLESARRQLDHFAVTHSNVIARLADTYSNTVSTLSPRIMVVGEQTHLSNSEVANKIRALLLAAMRSAVLFYQSGGNRFWLVLRRKAYLEEAQEFLRSPLLQ